MKKLAGRHIFAMAKIIKEGELKTTLGEVIAKAQHSEMSVEQLGIEGILSVIDACGSGKVEKRIYEFLDDVFETSFAEMPLEEIGKNFKQLAEENNLLAFFKSAGLLKQ